MSDKQKRAIMILTILTIVLTILGSTLAYWRWQSAENQKTNVTFTVAAGFSCSADGGGSINNNAGTLAPAHCDNATYAFKRTIRANVTNNRESSIYLDMWLNVNSIGTGLANSENFKYALTTGDDNCIDGVIASGNFYGATENTHKMLLNNKEYATTTNNDTYYLWIWLDAAETSSATMNQNFSLSLGGECTDEAPSEQTVYTVNLYDENGTNSVWLGQSIPNGITTYNTPEAAITALETAYSTANSGATTSLPFFLRHTVGDFSTWCIIMNNDTTNCLYSTPTEIDCNTVLSGAPNDGNTYTCSNITASNVVTESYVGFVVTPTMASANPGMVAGTYYLKGGDNGASFLDNAKTIYDAFGGVGCYLDDNSGGNPYTTTPSIRFECYASDLGAEVHPEGDVIVSNNGSNCSVGVIGNSICGG